VTQSVHTNFWSFTLGEEIEAERKKAGSKAAMTC